MEQLFEEHYAFLCLVSFGILKDGDAAKDVVQDFFMSYWQKRGRISLEVSFRAYATRAVRNLSLLSLEKDRKQKLLFQGMNVKAHSEQRVPEGPGKNQRLHKLLNRLPKGRKDIFISVVVHGQSYSEIAESNGISVNTVKTQMKRAYAFLRAETTRDRLFLVLCWLSLETF